MLLINPNRISIFFVKTIFHDFRRYISIHKSYYYIRSSHTVSTGSHIERIRSIRRC